MKRKAVVSLLLSGLLAASLVGVAAPASAGKTAKPVVVGEDPSGDWGTAVDPQIAPAGDALGQDLVGASIAMNGKDKVDFVMSLNSLPPSGGVPEITRYTWDFNVDGEFRELDGKFTNYSRGACDPTAGTCPPPRDPGMYPFSVRGNCGVTPVGTVSLTTCEELALVAGVFDATAGTVTVTVPLDALGAKPGSKITPGVNIFGGSISATPAAFVTNGTMPNDTMVVTKTFAVPR
jgi:hypothetical protein